jgi:hypothetical protein
MMTDPGKFELPERSFRATGTLRAHIEGIVAQGCAKECVSW